MTSLLYLPLAVNVAVLVPVTYGLITGAPWTGDSYGGASPARGILLAVYLAILIASLALMVQPVVPAIVTLLALQVLYKVMTPLTTGDWANPVVMANLGIAALHAFCLAVVLLRPAL